MNQIAPPSSTSWSRISQNPQYQALLKSKKSFIVPVSLFFIAYYFALPVLVGWWPELMKKPLIGPVNGAYLFALSEFFMAWTIAFLYVQKASKWDEQARQILSEETKANLK